MPLHHSRLKIGAKVRELRTERRWTQARLARHLELSQNRLSELERGMGSFSAEQFLEILRLFNIGIETFEVPSPREARLQNALIHFGARHLRETKGARSTGLETPTEAIEAVLLEPSSARLVTALAPVLVWSIDSVALSRLQHDLTRSGYPGRLPWLSDNTLTAMASLKRPMERSWRKRWGRAEVILGPFRERQLEIKSEDPFDPGVRSRKSLERIMQNASPPSRRWKVISRLQVGDFSDALEEACEH